MSEPSETIKTSVGIYSGSRNDAGSVDLSCPTVQLLANHGKTGAFAPDCTFNRYDGPVAAAD